MKKTPEVLDKIADTVLAYKPKDQAMTGMKTAETMAREIAAKYFAATDGGSVIQDRLALEIQNAMLL